jgi:hypothetical protein
VDGLDWLVKDVASRVYYGTTQTAGGINPLSLPHDITGGMTKA